MDPSKQTLLVGGLVVLMFTPTRPPHPTIPIHVLLFLHGRYGSVQRPYVVNTIKTIFNVSYGSGSTSPKKKDLLVVTFDHRNHGTRLVDKQRNLEWSKDLKKNNGQHAVDMCTVQTGSAQDVSFLIDHLPSFLYPSSQRTIIEWGMCGIDIGRNSTWIALSRKPRLKVGISIIGCPDYTKLMSERTASTGVPLKPPYFPDSLKAHEDANDLATFPDRAKDRSNPFLERKVLVLLGAKDPLVPWVASVDFVQNLKVGVGGIKRVVLEEGTGHKTTPRMQREAGLFVKKWLNDWCNAKL